jgi:hypothetical protein
MDYESLLKQIDAEIELLKEARAILTAASVPKKTARKVIAGSGSKKVRFRNLSGIVLSARSKTGAKKGRTSFSIFERKRGDGGDSGGTGDGGYGIVK